MRHSRTGLILGLFSCIFAFSVFLSGCERNADKLLGYQDGGIEAEICGRANSIDFSARLIILEPSESEKREFELTLTAPKTLEGLVFRRQSDGRLTLTVGEVELELSETDKMAATRIADLFLIAEEPIKISGVTGEDASLSQYERLTKVEFPSATVFIDPLTSLPVKLVSEDVVITVLSIEKR